MNLEDPHQYRALGYMIDGTPFFIRAVREWDRKGLLDLFNRSSQRSRYFRFFENKTSLTDAELDYYTHLDFYHHAALVAEVASPREGLVAVGRYIEILPEQSPRRAEVAFLTRDDYHGRGVATQLLKHLIRIARLNNIELFEAEMMASNTKMLEVFEHSGYELKHNREAGSIRVTFPIRDERIPF
ncbi:MAG: GNAT family N-acetyltransferase [Gammaproteobacteria bacterium]